MFRRANEARNLVAMRVAVDTNAIWTSRAGVARYVRGLLGGLRAIGKPDLDVRELAWEVENFAYRQPWRSLKTACRELVWAKAAAPRLLSKMAADLLHSAHGWLIRPPAGVKHVVTLHDLAALRHPERFRAWQQWSAPRRLRRLPGTDRVICVSQFTANEALRLLGLATEKIEVIYNGCDFSGREEVPESSPAEPAADEFFLFVGSLEPGKNLSLLRGAYLLAEDTGKPLPPLLVAGSRWEGVPREDLPPAAWRFLGRVTDDELVYLYRRAQALVFPSKYEGFGLPVIEAMALGCPVICSEVASLPEVAGEAAVYTEQTPQAYLQAMRSVLGDEGLRKEKADQGKIQSRRFTWARAARQTLDVYHSVLE